jgi:hypothetical protein
VSLAGTAASPSPGGAAGFGAPARFGSVFSSSAAEGSVVLEARGERRPQGSVRVRSTLSAAAKAEAIWPAVWKRSVGARAKARSKKASIPGGSPATRFEGGVTGSVQMEATISSREVPLKGPLPTSRQ